ncbi:MAG: protein BatD [Myxococcales bacterium]|nr:protein BatD [Myxococcales bacterium]
MTRTGDSALRWAGPAAAALSVLLSSTALAEVELYQSVDRNEVGTEDTFRLSIVVSGAPDTAQLQFPAPEDFEVLSRSQSTQMSYHFGGGGSSIKRVQKYELVMRANRAGTLTIPPAVLTTADRTYKTEAIEMQVKKGRLHTSPPPSPRRPTLPDPFRNFPVPSFPDPFGDLDDPMGFEPEIPRSDSDLFLRFHLDKEEVYVGEQTTLSLYIFSRLDVSSIDPVVMPKLEGFWSEELDSPSQLIAEQKVIDGVPYKAYLLRRRALFPMKPGALQIQPAEADITTGLMFAAHRSHRKSNALAVKVKPMPPGAPAAFSQGNVGRWRLANELSQTEVALGQPITAKVVLEGRGNLKSVSLPKLAAPPQIRVYEPTTSDKPASVKNQLGGKRVQEYLLMPQQTGTFTLPGLSFAFFNPETGAYEESKTDPIQVTALPGAGGANAIASGGPTPTSPDDSAKNKLEPAGLKPLRYQASFAAAAQPLWSRPYFIPLALAPLGLWVGATVLAMVRGALGREDEASRKRKKARAARARLAAAEKLAQKGTPDEFYGEVEKALLHLLEAKLGGPAQGLTRPQLDERMAAHGVPAERRAKVLSVLETCEMGRYAPGGGNAARGRALDDAEEAMEGWESR